ncbi:MAG: hypothetical protein ACI9CE_002532 [Flavobacterium sp.]
MYRAAFRLATTPITFRHFYIEHPFQSLRLVHAISL